jgi:DNA-binding MarR family transcriptional regulator
MLAAHAQKVSNKAMNAKTSKLTSTPNATKISMGPLNQRLGYVLRRAQLAVFADFFDAFAVHSIRPAQYSVLTIIASNPGLSQSQVAEVLGIKKPNFVTMIQSLEKGGLVQRTATLNDKRSNALSLTDQGEILVSKLEQIADRHEETIRKRLGEGSYNAMYEPLLKLGKMNESP